MLMHVVASNEVIVANFGFDFVIDMWLFRVSFGIKISYRRPLVYNANDA